MENRATKAILSVSFLLILFISFFDFLFGLSLDKTESTEKRTLNKVPEWSMDSLATWPDKYEKYFEDHFAFRNSLVKIHSLLTVKVLDISSVQDIIKGKDDWLYYIRKDQGNSLGDHLGLICLTDHELKMIASGLEYRKRILDSLHIPFVVVVAPDKNSIYPEYLPDNTKRKGPCIKRFDQVINYLKSNSKATLLDLRPALKEAKRNLPYLVYSKTDSHWSNYGGFIAYQEIMKALGLDPLPQSAYQWREVSGPGGDLAGELSLADRLIEERIVVTEPKETPLLVKTIVENDYGVRDMSQTHVLFENRDQNLPKLLIFHDSFGDALLNFMPRHFRETSCLATYQFSPNFFRTEKPDFVVLEIVERSIEQLLVKTYH